MSDIVVRALRAEAEKLTALPGEPEYRQASSACSLAFLRLAKAIERLASAAAERDAQQHKDIMNEIGEF